MSSLRRHHSDRTLQLHLHFQHNVACFFLDSIKDCWKTLPSPSRSPISLWVASSKSGSQVQTQVLCLLYNRLLVPGLKKLDLHMWSLHTQMHTQNHTQMHKITCIVIYSRCLFLALLNIVLSTSSLADTV